ncbi:hypothetical protein DPMN_155264 [Dreissena polymorpha]|uniref:Uncharacterized protein n=1 Tax=Dreissena polymorpha TaxID=45954 RepID=A0A9D4FMK3_DREPO|nr:hypothetical protein DPMN_155264 [Dreissena polymorpha]
MNYCVQKIIAEPLRHCHFTFVFNQECKYSKLQQTNELIYFMTLIKVQVLGFRTRSGKPPSTALMQWALETMSS